MFSSEPRHISDRNNMEILTMAQRQRVKDNIAAQVEPYMRMKESRISTADSMEIFSHIVRYGGRIEVEGLGTFFVDDVAGKQRFTGPGVSYWRPPYRRVDFIMSKELKECLNRDFRTQTWAEPNPLYFVEKRNLLI